MSAHNPISEIARLCRNQPILPAEQLSIAYRLPTTDPAVNHTGRQRIIASSLGHHVRRTITLEYYGEGEGILLHSNEWAIIGGLGIQLATYRPAKFLNWRGSDPSLKTTLRLLFKKTGLAEIEASGTLPLHEPLKVMTSATWSQVGMELRYDPTRLEAPITAEPLPNFMIAISHYLGHEKLS